jgi:RNA polymerase sigma factor (sigma-70 family)
MKESSDEVLFVAYCQGDSVAFEALFHRYQYKLCSHLEKMTNDLPAAEDMVVETFLRLHRHRHQYRGSDTVRGWIYTIARNLVRNWLRRERFKRWLPLTVSDPALTTEVPDMAEGKEVRELVAAAFAKLPLRQREVCSLRLLGELSLEDIKQVVGVPLGTVKSRLYYGQRRLCELLADLNPGKETKG